MKNFYSKAILRCLMLTVLSASGFAQTTVFSYQGKLTDVGSPANGSFQMQFKLYDSLGGGGQIGSTLTDLPVTVTDGIFSVKLDFGPNALSGADRWLEIAIRHNSGESYTTLAPREQVASSPYSVRTLSAASADNALNLGGVPASEYVTTTSNSFIRNGTTLQTGDFNITGNGLFGGNVGIGTTSPGYRLDVVGGPIRAVSGASNDMLVQTIGGTNAWARFSMQTPNQIWAIGLSRNFNSDQFYLLDTTNGQSRMTVQPAGGAISFPVGNVGIGTTAPTAGLSVFAQTANAGDNTANFVATNIGPHASHIHFGTTGDWYIRSAASSGKVILQDSGGYVGIGTNSPTIHLDVNGRARVRQMTVLPSTGGICTDSAGDLLLCGASSLKWKTDVRPFNLGLETVLRLRPINFTWKESGLTDFGLGAEDVAQVAPELSIFNANGEVEGVKYDRLSVVFVNAFKEQQSHIEAQQKQIEQQRAEIDALKTLVCSQNVGSEICRPKK